MIEFEIGLVFWDNPKKFKPKKYHVINVFEHEGERVVVFKYYSKAKQCWYMKADAEWVLNISFEYENYSLKNG